MTLSNTEPPDRDVDRQITVRVEALKLVKDWNAALIVVQSGLIAVVGGLLKADPPAKLRWLTGALLAMLIASIYIGAVVVSGTVPYVVQMLADRPRCDIYAQTGGIAKGWLAKTTLGRLCLLQAHLFVASLGLFAWFVLAR
jgi:hypothetical protein